MSSLKYNKSFETVSPQSGGPAVLYNLCDAVVRSPFCTPININGGGAQELMFIPKDDVGTTYQNGITYVASFKRNSTGLFQSKIDFISSYPSINHGVNVGDFNGDGLTDVLTKSRNASELWEIGYSNGISFNQPTAFYMGSPPANTMPPPTNTNNVAPGYYPHSFPYYLRPHDYTPMPDESPIITGDFNGDGKTDIAHFYTSIKNTNNPNKDEKYARIRVHCSNGSNTFTIYDLAAGTDEQIPSHNYYESDPTGLQHLFNNYTVHLGDFNGDGKIDVMNWIGIPSSSQSGITKPPHYVSIGAGQPNRLMTSIRNGYGLKESVQYEKINSNIYEDNHPSVYPLVSINGPLYAVSRHETFMQTGDRRQDNYKYKNLLALKDGRGLLGFSEIQKTAPFNNNLHSAITVQASSNYLPPFYAPTIQESRKYLDGLAPAQLISSQKDSSQLIAIGAAGRFMSRPLVSQATNHLSNTTKYTYYQAYDPDNNLTQVLETIPGIESSQRQITYAPASSTSSIVPYLPEQVITTLSKNNIQTVSTIGFTTYYKGRVRTQKQFYNSLAEVTTSYTYHPTGTVATKGMIAPGETPRLTSYSYDAKHRFVEYETNPFNQTVSSTYDPRFGVVRTATGFDGLTTTNQYDDFGKLRNTITPDGRTLTERWAWRTASKLTEGLIRKTVQDPAGTTSYTDYNALGNETEHGTKIWSGSGPADWSHDELKYNVEGQLLSKTMPKRSASETAIQLSYTYDSYGRPTKTCTQHGCTDIKYTYSGSNLTTEITDPANRIKYTIKDGADKLLQSKDESGILTYTYDGWGNVTQTKAGSVSLSTLAYDAYGRKTSITEPSSGTTSYTYTGYGELKTQTDAAGQTTLFEYDGLGRLWRTEFPEGSIVTDWYSSGGVGEGRQIRSISRADAQGNLEHSKTFFYDNLGRLKTTKYHNGRSTNWTYDALSRPATQTYVSGAMARYTYKDGQVAELRDGSNTVRYRLEDVNGLNNATQEWRGNGKTTLQSYDYGNLTSTFTPGVQDYRITHDLQRGLITRRTDGLAGVYDDFTYDPASRLTQTITGYLGTPPAILPPGQVQTYGQNAMTGGNILTKTDIGSYNYSKYHQISYTDNLAGAIPTVQQDIEYSSYHRPLRIAEGSHDARFTYDVSHERFSMHKTTNGALEYTKEYYDDGTVLYLNPAGIVTEKITPVASGNGIAWIQVDRQSRGGPEVPKDRSSELIGGRTEGTVVAEDSTLAETSALGDEEYINYSTTLYYPYADHLGSIMALTDGVGNVVHRQAFDPWGRRRNVNTWATDDSQVPPQQFRWLWGYTGHEQLDAFGLVNMNARLYDPKLGRLLSVDNYVSDPASPMAYNRYTYALNNPISYVDPSGNHPILVAMAIGAAISAASYTAQSAFTPGGLSRNFNIGDFASATITGAAMGALSWGVGQAFHGITVTGGMTLVKEAGRAAAHGLISGGYYATQGGDFLTGFVTGALSSFMSHSIMELGQVNLGKVGGAFFSMGVGAATSSMQGGDPWMGAAAALMGYKLNMLMSGADPGDGDGKRKNTNVGYPNGHLELGEANHVYRTGGGKAVDIDINQLDLSYVYAEDFPQGVGSSQTFNLLLKSRSLNDGLVLGNITLILHENNIVTALPDFYNFEMHSWFNPVNWGRNFETLIGRWNAGAGTPYPININGTARIQSYDPNRGMYYK
ncbi:MAG: hypothetical protein EOP52_03565 [Sphingobacteriales bacterium]|nr:MAG: hypothetical protein EOP52_03565 [Sphingobacteriales bacterium]